MTDAPKIVPTEHKESGAAQTGKPNHKPEIVGPAVETKPAVQPAPDKK